MAVPCSCIWAFQSTLPVRGATPGGAGADAVKPISIHAPREGSDRLLMASTSWSSRFQSTLPVRGATRPRTAGRTWYNFNPRSP